MKLYVASSWRNTKQPLVVAQLRDWGHEVYDFRNPREDDSGFHWSEIDPDWQHWAPIQFRNALKHPLALKGFRSNVNAMCWADACVLVLPCGRSAHLEAGWFTGEKPLYILLSDGEPELMYAMATKLCVSLDKLKAALAET